MPLRRRAVLASLLLWVTACRGDHDRPTAPSDAPVGPPRAHGRLIDFASAAPLAGVSLAFGVDVAALDRRTTTDASGAYSVEVPAGRVYVAVDGDIIGELVVPAPALPFRGDLLGNGGGCISRYGVISDAATFRPVAGATVRLGGRSMVTGPDGWYRIDLGCVDDPFNNFGTTLMYVDHPAYRPFSRVLGRGIHRVRRIDGELQIP